MFAWSSSRPVLFSNVCVESESIVKSMQRSILCERGGDSKSKSSKSFLCSKNLILGINRVSTGN